MRWPTITFHRIALLVALCAAGAAMPIVQAAGPSGFGAPVDAAELDTMRGGFEIAGGLSLSLGIERVVSVNGEVLARTNIAIPDLAAMTGDQARLAQNALGAAQLIQIGGNNYAAADLNLPNGATLLQNTLNGQDIRTATTITSTVNSMSLLKDMNFQSTIRDAVVRSPGTL
ncbi:hypothetical protein [Massilia timonae]|uniref:Uncharacterized protein n=1 Tax=Massilia timonae CCUG 45783 TaxID=883126 RepID=K9DIQ1_9BURK|nr:hypothetical protein [Massilia timonae]EKU84168.1 hypothetical protein HMPREF9710_00327 [Massilia timonae CCUG 45783]